jgi:HSP20 family molecular chaperone IbpA
MRSAMELLNGNRIRLGDHWGNRGGSRLDGFGDLFEEAFWNQPSLSILTRNTAVDAAPAEFRVEEMNDAFLLSVDIPGVRSEDVKVEVADDTLSVSGERSREVSADGGKRIERLGERFERKFTLTAPIDEEKIEANLDNGVLTIVLPKAETKKARAIQVQPGKSGFLSKIHGVGESPS